MLPMLGFVELQQGQNIVFPPQVADASRSFRHARIELEFRVVYPRMGGSSVTAKRNFVSFCLNTSALSIVFIWNGIQFHSLGPMTANEESYKVLFAAVLFRLRPGTLD